MPSDPTPEAPATEAATAEALAKAKKREHRLILGGLALGVVLLVGAFFAWRYYESHPSTKDAYLKANFVWIAPQVAGEVVEVGVGRNQRIHKGDLLFRIDPRPFAERLARAQAEQAIVQLKNAADLAAVAASQDVVRERASMLKDAQDHYEQLMPLIEKGFMPELRGVDLSTNLADAQERLQDARAAFDQASLDEGNARIQESRALAAAAEVALAEIELGWTKVVAPFDGWTTESFDLRVGTVVEPGRRLFPLVEAGSWWVQANFKETVLQGMRPGLPVSVTVDMYDGHEFDGYLESISPASAAAFSLLPPENTTGNWVKVTQRIPVRIALPANDPERPYRLGASCEVEIDIDAKPAKQPQSASAAPR